MRDIKIQVYLEISEVHTLKNPPMRNHSNCTTKEIKQEVEPTPMTVGLFIAILLSD